MKVIVLTHSFPRFSGDAPGSFILRLAVALMERGIESHVLAPAASGYPREEVIEGIAVERFRYAPRRWETLAYTGNMAGAVAGSLTGKTALAGYLAAGSAASIAMARRLRPHIVHAHWWFPSALTARFACAVSGAPLVTTMHGTDLRMARLVKASRPFLRSVVHASAQITTVSGWLASELTALVPEADPVVAPMPVATERFAPGGRREAARFLFAGRLNEQKGLRHLLKAFAAMTRPAMLDIVGEGPDGESLRVLASQLGVSDRVIWKGQISREDLLQSYQSATALVMPSVGEGLGLVAAEALLCETPVIAFRSGGLIDIVKPDVTGSLVEPGDTAALAQAMDSVLESPARAAELARAGRRFVLDAFSPDAAARQYAALYESVVRSERA